MKKRLFIFLLAAVLLAVAFALSASASSPAGTVAEGTCGSGLIWVLDDAGALTISGTGSMTDWTYSSPAPWSSYDDAIYSIVIEEGVTTIGDYAFYDVDCIGVYEIVIPEGVTSIGKSAFESSGFSIVRFPDTLTYIGEYAFARASLTGIVIPASVEGFGLRPFWECPLGYITFSGEDTPAFDHDSALPPSATHVFGIPGSPAEHFALNNGFNFYALPKASGTCGEKLTWTLDYDGTLTISGTGAMEDYTSSTAIPWDSHKESIRFVVLEEGVTSVGKMSFYAHSNLNSVTIPSSVTSIGGAAFSGCTNLSSITIPSSVTSIGNHAFSGCTNLTIHGYVWSYAETYAAENSIPFVSHPITGTCGDALTWTLDDAGTLTISGTGAMEDYTSSTAIPWNSRKEYIRSVVLEEGVTTIGKSAFFHCAGLTSISIPNRVTSIGNHAFSVCAGLTSITLPDGVTTIDDYAFAGCTGLTNITISDNVTTIGYGAFSGCSSLTAIRVGEGNTSYSDTDGVLFDKARTKLICFPAAKPNTAYAIPSGVTSIESYAFYACTNLTSITLPDSVMSIGSHAFKNCRGLTSITIPARVTLIGYYTFQGCSSLTSITIPARVTLIGYYAFQGCSSLTSITIPASVTSINSTAFEGCTNLTIHGYVWSYAETYAAENSIPFVSHPITGTCGDALTWTLDGTGTLTISGTGAMDSNPWKAYLGSITSAVIEEGVTSIGSAFRNCANLKTVTLPDSLTSIGGTAFLYCESLTTLHIPAGVTWIGNYAFSECNSLTTITVAEENTAFSADENGVLFNKDKTVLLNYPDGKTDDSYTIPAGVTTIGTGAFNYCDFTTVLIPEGVLVLDGNAFEKCENLTDITIPASVTAIAGTAFADCPNLTIHGHTGTAAETYATDHDIPFEALSGPIKGTCGENLTWTLDDTGTLTISGTGEMSNYNRNTIPWKEYLESITSVAIEEGVTSIGNYAFCDCANLVSIQLPAGLTSIGTWVFENCVNLKSITLPDSLTSIGTGAFIFCESLTSLTIPVGVTSIGTWAFSECLSLPAFAVAEGNTAFSVDAEGVLFDKDKTVLIAYPDSKTDSSYAIPEGVTTVGTFAFNLCDSLISVTLPDSLTTLETGAFEDCIGLTSMTIPAGVTMIGGRAFEACTSLSAFTVAEGNTAFTVIDGVLFSTDMTQLVSCPAGKPTAEYTIPGTVRTLTSRIFYQCTNLSYSIPGK